MFIYFLDRVSCVSGLLQTPYVAKEWSWTPIILPLPPKCWGSRQVPPCPVYGVLEKSTPELHVCWASTPPTETHPSSICPAVWIVGLRDEGWWGRCALDDVCSLREAAGTLGTRPLPGMAVSTHLGALFMLEGQVYIHCLHALSSGYSVNPLGQ